MSPDGTPWLDAAAVQQRLGIARQTLYAYVSRGLLRSRAAPDDPRRSLYSGRDVAVLMRRQQRGRARRDVAAATIDHGDPILESAITHIANGRMFYRGQDAIRLAETATLEQVAALLWRVDELPPVTKSTYVPDPPGPWFSRCVRRIGVQTLPGIWGRSTAALLDDAASLLRLIPETLINSRADPPIHLALARCWGGDARQADLLRRALVLCADHELNPSTFAVRVVASTGASLPACLLAGFAAFSGPLHGGATDQVRAFVAEPAVLANPSAAVAARLARGERIPGFGQRLYPDGDPRALSLLAAMKLKRREQDLLLAVEQRIGRRPNLDAALVLLERHLRLPKGAARVLLATGRTAGWIAHAIEQRDQGQIIRPRARYSGPLSDPADVSAPPARR